MITNMLTNLIKSMMSNTSVIFLFRYGVTDIFINDNGNEFVNLIAEICMKELECNNILHHHTIPPDQWIVERVNRTTTDRLKTMISEQADWVDALQTVAWVHRSTCHASTNYEISQDHAWI